MLTRFAVLVRLLASALLACARLFVFALLMLALLARTPPANHL